MRQLLQHGTTIIKRNIRGSQRADQQPMSIFQHLRRSNLRYIMIQIYTQQQQ